MPSSCLVAGSSGCCFRPQETQKHWPGVLQESPEGSLRTRDTASLGWQGRNLKLSSWKS